MESVGRAASFACCMVRFQPLRCSFWWNEEESGQVSCCSYLLFVGIGTTNLDRATHMDPWQTLFADDCFLFLGFV